MKLSESVSFNKKTLKVNGLVNLGNYTPEHQINSKGDHALVLMYQPFRGKWVQALAVFLSKGCASSTVLHKIVMECVILLERSGFHVDGIATDGATWNRSMWTKFGISSENVSCEHIYDSSRRLWFLSDFPHLIKNFRNCIVKQSEFWTPDGIVKLKHWDAIITSENPFGYNLKLCPGLSNDDVHPKPYQKMNVGRAYRFFGEKTAIAMEIYRENNMDLIDCEPSVILIRRINSLIQAMDSRIPSNSLRKASPEYEVIKRFIHYLDEWHDTAKKNNYNFLTDSTYFGLKVSLKATLEIFDYLETCCDYHFLMTARLNQDNLERFFSMMRSSCGSNDHPDSVLFVQIFKLICTYSLVKPPKGSNITGGELLSSLFSINDLNMQEDKRIQFRQAIDNIIDQGSDCPDVMDLFSSYYDHDYTGLTVTNDPVLAYIGGYVARKATRFTKCINCLSSLKSEISHSRDVFIDKLSHGHLIKPSEKLFKLISTMEAATLYVLNEEGLSSEVLFSICSKLEQIESLQLIGCDLHADGLTSSIVNFFLITRVHFVCSRSNSIDNAKKEKSKLHRKSAKLV